jgi:hypothetical protein
VAKPNKTRPTAARVDTLLAKIPDPVRRKDSETLIGLMTQATGHEPKIWGTSIIGFGEYHYRYESGREGDMCLLGFAPRKDGLVLYFCAGLEENKPALSRLGRHKTGKGCLYIKRLEDIHLPTLTGVIAKAAKRTPKGAVSA